MLANARISTKILSIIGVLAVVSAGITATSVTSMQALSLATDEIDLTATEIRLGAYLNRLTVELNRDEYRLAADPGAFAEAAATIAKDRQLILDTLAAAGKTADPNQARLLAGVDAAMQVYKTELDGTLRIAERIHGQVSVSEAQREILKSVDGSRDKAKRLQEAATAYVDYTERKGTTISTEASALADSRTTLLIVVASVGILLGLVLGWLISTYGIVRPIQAIVSCLRDLADGNLNATIFGVGRKDEVGEIAETADVFKRNLVRTREMEQEAKENEARAAAEKRRAMLDLAGRFENRIGGIVNAVGSASTELQATASQLAAAVEEVSAQCTAVAAASEEASSNVQTVASASEEMSASIQELSERVSRAAGRSKAAAQGAEQAQRQLDTLSSAIDQVDQIVAAINAVASQTNLLALNATIEAARAGEAGKGFAVVASEVKNLANQTHSMTDQIGSQISAVKEASARTVQAMRAIISQVEDIDHSTSEMAASVEQQSAATSEISRNAQQAAMGTAEVARNVCGIQQAESETSSATSSVKTAADSLAEQSATLKREVDTFLAEVRAA